MNVQHLNCGTLCPVGGRLMDGPGRGPGPAKLVCHCLLIETANAGLVLIDTGLGIGDVLRPRPRLDRLFLSLLRPPLKEEETALRQVERLGHHARDVRHILLTHLDFDHAGGLEDFPQAIVHVLAPEHQAAMAVDKGFVGRGRYRPAQWQRVKSWQLYEPAGENWFGFASVRGLHGLPPEILFIPLPGHTPGHAGIAIDTGQGWLLHAGDAYFHEGEMAADPWCPLGLRAYQRLMEVDRAARLNNQRRLRALARDHAREVRVFSAHDAHEFQRHAGAAPMAPSLAAPDARASETGAETTAFESATPVSEMAAEATAEEATPRSVTPEPSDQGEPAKREDDRAPARDDGQPRPGAAFKRVRGRGKSKGGDGKDRPRALGGTAGPAAELDPGSSSSAGAVIPPEDERKD